jgi:hypothetical protein
MLAPIGAKTLFIFSLFLIVFTFSLGFAFVYFEDERDGDEAIRALDGYPFGPGRRRLSVEWSRVISLAVLVTTYNPEKIETCFTYMLRVLLFNLVGL